MPANATKALMSSRNFARIRTGMMKYASNVKGCSGYSMAKAATSPNAPADAPTTGAAKAPPSRTPASA